jgi:hypothetical protein
MGSLEVKESERRERRQMPYSSFVNKRFSTIRLLLLI